MKYTFAILRAKIKNAVRISRSRRNYSDSPSSLLLFLAGRRTSSLEEEHTVIQPYSRTTEASQVN